MEQMVVAHSAKGTTWSNHKYIKIVNGRYVYPDSGQAGTKVTRKISKGSSSDTSQMKEVGSVKNTVSKKPGVVLKTNTKETKVEPVEVEETNVLTDILKKTGTLKTEKDVKNELNTTFKQLTTKLPAINDEDRTELKQILNKIGTRQIQTLNSGNDLIDRSQLQKVNKKKNVRTLKAR